MPSIDPQIPKPKPEKRKRTNDDDSDSESGTSRSSSPKDSISDSKIKCTRMIGPALPPKEPVEQPSEDGGSKEKADSSSEEDDDFGPSLPSTNEISSHTLNRSTTETNSSVNNAPSKRDDWMLKPPTSGDWSSKADPTKLKNRKFNTIKGAKGPSQSKSEAADTWHETPMEKQARLQREIMGIATPPTSQKSRSDVNATQNAETANRLKDYTDKARGPSLYESYKQKNPQEKDDDPSARAFDREKDIAGGLQINQTQRKEMVKKAADFQTRFSSAKYL